MRSIRWRRCSLALAACALLACSDDTSPSTDVGTGDISTTTETGAGDTAPTEGSPGDSNLPPGDGNVPPGDGPPVSTEGGTGQCTAWPQWSCSEPTTGTCQASCTFSGTPLALECTTKGGHVNCECSKSGSTTGCMYSGPAPATCDSCKAAFNGGCCNPP